MDFLDIIGKVIEFSEKGEEYSDEIKAFRATLESLQLTVQKIEPEDMPNHLSGMLNDNLQEAKELLNKVGNANSTWLTNIRNMLPGSHLQKIKEKNQQLVHIITLINLHLNSSKNTKRALETALTTDFDAEEPTKLKRLHTYSTSATTSKSNNFQKKSQSDTKFDLLGPTLDASEDDSSVLEGPTQADGDGDGMENGEEGYAFRLRVLYDERLGKALKGCKDFVPMIEKGWEGSTNAEYIFQRINYAYLPMEDVKRLSRDHAVINAIKGSGGGKEDYAVTATVPDDDKLYGATIADDGEEEKMNGNGNGAAGGKTEFILKDLSLNGTYYMKKDTLLNFPPGGMKISGDFKLLSKNEQASLENGDIIGLIMQKPHCKELIFGFQLLTE